jgi:hypothetical protein
MRAGGFVCTWCLLGVCWVSAGCLLGVCWVSAGCLLVVSPRSVCHTCVLTQPALRQKAVGARADALF